MGLEVVASVAWPLSAGPELHTELWGVSETLHDCICGIESCEWYLLLKGAGSQNSRQTLLKIVIAVCFQWKRSLADMAMQQYHLIFLLNLALNTFWLWNSLILPFYFGLKVWLQNGFSIRVLTNFPPRSLNSLAVKLRFFKWSFWCLAAFLGTLEVGGWEWQSMFSEGSWLKQTLAYIITMAGRSWFHLQQSFLVQS